jgi:hypothetical protein
VSVNCQSAIVADTAANVVARLSTLGADGLIDAIELTDSGMPTLNLTVAQMMGNGRVLREINTVYRIAISDSVASITGNLDILAADDRIASVSLTDSGTPTFNLGVAQALADRPFFDRITNSSVDVAVADTAEKIAGGSAALNADPHVGSIVVRDTAANVSGHLDALNGGDGIDAITLTDTGTPVLSLTVAQALGDAATLSKVTNATFAIAVTDTAAHVAGNGSALAAVPHVQSITVADTVTNVLANAAALSADTAITTIAITDTLATVAANGAALSAIPNLALTVTGTAAEIAANLDALNGIESLVAIVPAGSGAVTLNLTAAQAVRDGNAIAKIAAFVITKVVDTAANISANFDALAFAWQVRSITLTDGETSPLILGAAQLSNDFMASFKITNETYSIVISDTVANLIGHYFYPLSGNPRVTSIAVSDTAVNILNGSDDLGFLLRIEPRFSAVTVSDTAAAIIASLDALRADSQITAIVVVDTAANIAANLDALNAVPLLASITLTDSGVPTLNLTAGQLAHDRAALGVLSNPSTLLTVSDTAANVAANLEALNADPRVSAITLTDAGTPTLALSIGQALADSATLAKIGNTSLDLGLNGTAADIEALTASQIARLGVLHAESIAATDASMALTVEQAAALEAAAITVSVPQGNSAALADTAANLALATAALISGLPTVGFSAIVAIDASVSFTVDQTAAIVAANLSVSAPAGDTVTENFADGSQTVLTFGSAGGVSSALHSQADGFRTATVYGVIGQPYASYENVYDASWTLTSQKLFNSDGSIYQSLTVVANADGTKTTTHFDGAGTLTSQSIDGPNGHDVSV